MAARPGRWPFRPRPSSLLTPASRRLAHSVQNAGRLHSGFRRCRLSGWQSAGLHASVDGIDSSAPFATATQASLSLLPGATPPPRQAALRFITLRFRAAASSHNHVSPPGIQERAFVIRWPPGHLFCQAIPFAAYSPISPFSLFRICHFDSIHSLLCRIYSALPASATLLDLLFHMLCVH